MVIVSGAVEAATTDRPANLARYICALVAANPDGQFIDIDLRGHTTTNSYRSLLERAQAIATNLVDVSIDESPVILCYAAISEYVPAAWGCLLAGREFYPVPSDLLFRDKIAFWETLEKSISLIGAHMVLADSSTSELLQRATVDSKTAISINDTQTWVAQGGETRWLDDDNLKQSGVYIQTSGSTGFPKLAHISGDTLIHRFFDGVGYDTRVLLNVLASHSIGGMRLLLPLGRKTIFLNPARLMTVPKSWFDLVSNHGVTDVGLTNSNVSKLVSHLENGGSCDAQSIKRLAFGAEPIKRSTIGRFFEFLQQAGMHDASVSFVYSMTETGPLFTSTTPVAALEDVQWAANDGYEFTRCSNSWSMRIRNDDGQFAAEGEPGSIEVYSKTRLFSGYQLDRSGFTEDGWFDTGDRGVFENNRLRLIGREKNVIIVHGKKTTCEEIEAKLATIPELRAKPVFASGFRLPSDDTDRLVLFIDESLCKPEDRDTILTTMGSLIAQQFGLAIHTFFQVTEDQIPRTSTGKIDRVALVRHTADDTFPVYEPATREASVDDLTWPEGTRGEIAQLWASVLKIVSVPQQSDDFYASGGDSLALAELLLGAESQFNVDIAPADFLNDPTLARLSNLVLSEAANDTLEASPVRVPDVVSWHHKLSGQWSEDSTTTERLVFARNEGGENTPLFWVFQEKLEFEALAQALGPNQPLFGMRSLVGIVSVRAYQENYRQIGQLLTTEISDLVGDRPFILGGNCQGAIIALDIARRMTQKQKAPESLILLEWTFSFGKYDGDTLFLYGARSPAAEFYSKDAKDQFWRTDFKDTRVGALPCGHGAFFHRENVDKLAGYLLEETCRPMVQYEKKAVFRPFLRWALRR